ncbi:wsv108 [White spot syndrome virus]|uniref:Wsv108 n=1 Tax=White spot syndrome virus TaxID=342409 RepID=K7WJF6_9VIRU|nr:wsv108 [White spot syndrome virus]
MSHINSTSAATTSSNTLPICTTTAPMIAAARAAAIASRTSASAVTSINSNSTSSSAMFRVPQGISVTAMPPVPALTSLTESTGTRMSSTPNVDVIPVPGPKNKSKSKKKDSKRKKNQNGNRSSDEDEPSLVIDDGSGRQSKNKKYSWVTSLATTTAERNNDTLAPPRPFLPTPEEGNMSEIDAGLSNPVTRQITGEVYSAALTSGVGYNGLYPSHFTVADTSYGDCETPIPGPAFVLDDGTVSRGTSLLHREEAEFLNDGSKVIHTVKPRNSKYSNIQRAASCMAYAVDLLNNHNITSDQFDFMAMTAWAARQRCGEMAKFFEKRDKDIGEYRNKVVQYNRGIFTRTTEMNKRAKIILEQQQRREAAAAAAATGATAPIPTTSAAGVGATSSATTNSLEYQEIRYQ